MCINGLPKVALVSLTKIEPVNVLYIFTMMCCVLIDEGHFILIILGIIIVTHLFNVFIM